MATYGFAKVCLATRDPAKRDKTCEAFLEMSYYVYVLKSQKNNDIYVGSTANLQKRIYLHNYGEVKSTKGYRPWKLLEYHKFSSRNEATKIEKFLKNHQQKEILKRKYDMVA